LLAAVALVALGAFWFWRHQFEAHRPGGQVALGCLMGGIVGNLLDRLVRGHVVDFLRFYWTTRSGNEIGFPAFNVADMGITTSVIIILLLTWQSPPQPQSQSQAQPQSQTTGTAPMPVNRASPADPSP
jgi:signal peptidase II